MKRKQQFPFFFHEKGKLLEHRPICQDNMPRINNAEASKVLNMQIS
jgi:hypothetical protein